MNPPQWVIDELARREQHARETYRRLAAEIEILCTEAEYVARALELENKMNPLTWAAASTER